MPHTGQDPDDERRGRSECVFTCCLAMAAVGYGDEQFEALLLNPEIAISAHVLDQTKPAEYLARQIEKARAKTLDADVARLNEDFAFIVVGGKGAIMKATNGEIELWTVDAFKGLFANQFIWRNSKKRPLGDY